MVNGNVKKPSTPKELLLGWANLVLAEVLSLLVNLFTAGLMLKSSLFKGVVGLCTLAILCCIVGNYAYVCAKHHRAYERVYQAQHRSAVPKLLGIGISLPLLLQWVALVVLKATQAPSGDGVFSVYRLVNAYYLPLVNLLCPNHTLAELSVMGAFTLFVLSALPAIAYVLVYGVTYHNVDVERLMVYNRD